MSSTSRRLVWALRCVGLALIALRLAAPLLTEKAAWGLWPATYLPVGARWALAAAAAGLVMFGDRLRLPPLHRVWFSSPTVRLALALLSAIPFYLFRIQHLRWGDAYILVNAIPHPEVRLTYTWQAPLDLFVHARAWQLGNRLFGWPDPMPVYWILSTAAGVVFVWALLGLALEMGRSRGEQLLIVALVGTLGTMQLFFGYIENYTLMTLGVLLYLWLALRTLAGQTKLVWPATALALTNAFHPSTLVLLPGLGYLAARVGRWWRAGAAPGNARSDAAIQGPADRIMPSEPEKPPQRLKTSASGGFSTSGGRSATPGPGPEGNSWAIAGRAALCVAVPYVLIFGGVVALMTAGGHGLAELFGADAPGGGDHRWLVPLFQTTTRWEHYTMFSAGHLADIANQQLLVAPMIWPALLLSVVFARRRIPWRDPALRFLGLAALLYLALTLVWNPDYGGQRDWDLFAPAAVPAALLLGYVLPRALPEGGALRAAAWALIPPQAIATLAWVYQNTLPWSWP